MQYKPGRCYVKNLHDVLLYLSMWNKQKINKFVQLSAVYVDAYRRILTVARDQKLSLAYVFCISGCYEYDSYHISQILLNP